MKEALIELERILSDKSSISREELTSLINSFDLNEEEVLALKSFLMANNIKTRDFKPEIDIIDSIEEVPKEELREECLLKINKKVTQHLDILGLYVKDISRYPLLTVEEEKELAQKVQDGDELARKKLINSNLRLAFAIAKKYTNSGMDLLDLIQEGNIGLMKAVDRFDVSKGYRFSTYAHWWIKQSITRSIADKSRTIRLPVYLYERLRKFNLIEADLTEQGLKVTDNLLASTMGLTIDEIKELKVYREHTLSLDTPVKDDTEFTLGDTIQSEYNTEDDVLNSQIQNELIKIIDSANLKDRDKEIFFKRYGFYDGEKKTLSTLSEEYNITREGIRQIEVRCLKKIKTPKNIRKLESLL